MYGGNKHLNMYFGGNLKAVSKAALFMHLHYLPTSSA